MKRIILLLLFILASINLFSQESKIYFKDGTVIGLNSKTIEIKAIDKKIKFRTISDNKKESVKFDEIDSLKDGNVLYRYYELDIRKSKGFPKFLYRVLVETPKYTLIDISVTKIGEVSSLTREFVYILDKKNNILEDLNYYNTNSKGDLKDKERTISMLKKYFSDISFEMDLLKNTTDEKNRPAPYLYLRNHELRIYK